MVIETTIKSTNNKALIDDLSICSVEEHNNGTSLWLYGKDTPTIISMPFDEAKQVFIEAKKRDKFTGETPLGIYDFPKPSPKDSILKSFQDNPIHKQLKEIESLGYEVKPGKTSLGGDALQIVKKPVFKSTETISVGGFILPIYEPTTGSTKKLDTNFWCYLIGRGETRGYEELNELLSSIKMEDFDKHFPLAKQ